MIKIVEANEGQKISYSVNKTGLILAIRSC